MVLGEEKRLERGKRLPMSSSPWARDATPWGCCPLEGPVEGEVCLGLATGGEGLIQLPSAVCLPDWMAGWLANSSQKNYALCDIKLCLLLPCSCDGVNNGLGPGAVVRLSC